MDKIDDRKAPRAPPPLRVSKSDASGASREREARLAAALRANLRKRKARPAARTSGGD